MNESSAQFRNNGKNCEYHKDKGHTTQECKALAKALIDINKLTMPQVNFVDKQNSSKTIFVIMGNITPAKRNLEVLTFAQCSKKIKLVQDRYY